MRAQDVHAVLELVGDVHHADDLDEFRATILAGLPRLVATDYVSYNEVPRSGGPGVALVAPDLPPWAYERWERYGAQNPLVARFVRTRDGRAYRFSDVASPAELHALELYTEMYRQIGVEHQLAFGLPSPATTTIGIAFSRGGEDFSERDRRLVDLARPHLIQAWRNAELRERARAIVGAIRRGLDEAGQAMVLVAAGEIVLSSAAARRMLRAATGAEVADDDRLPQPLAAWLEGGAPVPLVLGGRRPLVVRHLPGRPGEPDVLFLEPGARTVGVAVLRELGLTAREAEVLALIVRGQSNEDVAAELRISPRTVHKHVEHVFAKLGVSSRLEAVATVWAAVGVDGVGDRPAV
jgi:DNA-binding CsgD family transcriptional regulator/GAF domain-containing protein